MRPDSVVPNCAVVALLQMPRVLVRHAEILGDEIAHAVIDLGEQVAFRRIERVVEIEHPDACGVEAARRVARPPLEAQSRPASRASPAAALPAIHALFGLGLAPADQRADAVIGEQLEQHAVRHAAVDDDDGLDARFHHLDAALDLGDHAARDGAVADQLRASSMVSSAIRLPVLVEHAFDVGQQQQALGLHARGKRAGERIGVDVERLAFAARRRPAR